MSLDLVAVQRDEALLDALSQRRRPVGIGTHRREPVVGLLAALVADVDDGLPVDGVAPCIPEQSRRQPSPARILTLAVPAAPVAKRHAARAIAALAVAAAVLSAGGVAAAVSGDPLTPYKSVVNVVRGGFNNVMPDRSMIAPEPLTKTPKPKAKLAAAKAERTAKAARRVVSTRSSRGAWRTGNMRSFWDRDARHRQGWDRNRWNRYGFDRKFVDRSAPDRRFSDRNSRDRDRRQWGGSGPQAGWGDGGGQDGGGTGGDSSDSGGQGDGGADGRR
jgi:hypothetical protein